jgi:outer membrane protein assembly factor BamB
MTQILATLIALLGALHPAGALAADRTSASPIPNISVEGAPEWDCLLPDRPLDPRWVVWRAATGSKVASPVIAGDRIIVGTNNEEPGKSGMPGGDLGVIMCFEASNGKALWRITHERLGSRKHDMPRMPITSRPAVDGDRVYYVSNRGELVCAGIRDTAARTPAEAKADGVPAKGSAGVILWKLDMLRLGVNKAEAPDVGNPTSGPLVVGDLVYCVTGNGGDFQGLPAPDAPSFIAVNKMSGKLAWSSNAPGKNIVLGQWSSPELAEVQGQKQILFPGGDGYLYGFEPLSGKILWKIDLGGVPAGDATYPPRGIGTRNFFVGAPVVHGNTVYVGLGQIPEDNFMRTRRPVYAVELSIKDGITHPHVKWTFDHKKFDGTTAAVSVSDGKVYTLSQSGFVFALDEGTGHPIWMSKLEQQAALFSSPYVHSGRLYVADEDGQLFCFVLGATPRCLGKFQLGAPLFDDTPVVDGDRLYMGAGGYLWALVPPSDGPRN